MSVLTPESRRWLDAPPPAGARVTVAGVAGGVGTTTVTALLWWALTTYGDRTVALLDHGGGALGSRLPAATATRSPDLVLHDAGTVMPAPREHSALVLVCGAHEPGLAAAAAALRQYAAGPDDAWRRCVVVPVATTGAGLSGAQLRHRAHGLGVPAALLPLRRAHPLAAGGDVPGPGVSRSLTDAHRTGAAIAAEVLRCLASAMGSSTHPKSR